jgi:hypothetical protein
MSRFVKVSDTNYKLSVASGGNITLDTGDQVGLVTITGDLLVLGETTTINTTQMTIEDNVIILNKGEVGNSVTEVVSGIEIDRGAGPAIQFFYDESISWFDSQFDDISFGAFVLKNFNGLLIGLKTNSIITDNSCDLVLLGEGTKIVTVKGTENYEQQIFPYVNDLISSTKPIDEDGVPNARALRDFVPLYLKQNPAYKLQDSSVDPDDEDTVTLHDSILEIHDSESDGGISNLELILDNTRNAIWYPTYHEMHNIKFSSTRIESTAVNTDLVLASPGTGSVAIDDNLKLKDVVTDVAGVDDGVRIYSKAETYLPVPDTSNPVQETGFKHHGGSGIYFVNTDGVRDELVSKRKAIAYGMIF